jgi:transposase
MSATNPDQRPRYVGIDVCLLPAEGEFLTVANDQEGIGTLLGRLQRTRPELVVLEASGRYECPVAAAIAASEARIAVAVVNPRQAPDFARATGRLAKIERIDAEITPKNKITPTTTTRPNRTRNSTRKPARNSAVAVPTASTPPAAASQIYPRKILVSRQGSQVNGQ